MRDWMRDENGDPAYFDVEVHQLLDLTIRDDKYLGRRFQPWDLMTEPTNSGSPVTITKGPRNEYTGWGDF